MGRVVGSTYEVLIGGSPGSPKRLDTACAHVSPVRRCYRMGASLRAMATAAVGGDTEPVDMSTIRVRGRVRLGRPDAHELRGRETTYAGMRAYVCTPPDQTTTRGIAVVGCDIWGIDLPYARLWTDRLAEAG